MATPLEILKFNLQEREYPYFENEELNLLLETNDNDVKKASYQGCLMKANADDKLEVAGVKLSSNREYWLTLSEQFKPTKIMKYGIFKNTVKRSDRL
ncbi:hypothetical protein ACYIU4_002830 [Clostridium botulinum]